MLPRCQSQHTSPKVPQRCLLLSINQREQFKRSPWISQSHCEYVIYIMSLILPTNHMCMAALAFFAFYFFFLWPMQFINKHAGQKTKFPKKIMSIFSCMKVYLILINTQMGRLGCPQLDTSSRIVCWLVVFYGLGYWRHSTSSKITVFLTDTVGRMGRGSWENISKPNYNTVLVTM